MKAGLDKRIEVARPAQRHPARRRLIAGAVMALAGLGVYAADEISHAAEAIHQEVVIKASPERVYETLMSAERFHQVEQLGAAMHTGTLGTKPTTIDREAGGAFTLFGGHIVGRQIELVPNQRIVEAWRVVTWDPGVYSIARFALVPEGSDTKIVFDHTAFPVGQAQHLAEGWRGNYWEPLEKYLASEKPGR